MTVVDRLVHRGVTRDSIRGRVIDLAASAADASHYLLTPRAVVIAESEAAVSVVVRACTAEGFPVTFRSGGTSLSGQATGDGVLVDVRRAFRGVEVLDDGARVRVAPGTTVRAVNAALRPYARLLGPDPASEAACTIGGVVANNSSGMSCGTAGNAYNTLDSVRVILPSGTVVDTSSPEADAQLAHTEPRLHEGLVRLRDAVRDDHATCAEIRRLFAIKNTMGYGVNSFLDHDSPSEILAHLIVGSEGTLAFVASATFRTLPLRPYSATGLLVLPDLDEATGLLPDLVATQPAAVELLDTRSLEVAARGPRTVPQIAELQLRTQAALLVEYQAESLSVLQTLVEDARPALMGVSPSTDPVVRADLWHVRKGLYAAVAGSRRSGTTALLEDVAVPVPALKDACTELASVFARFGYNDSVVFGHAKDGNIHFMVNEDLGSAAGIGRYSDFTDDMVDVVLDYGGTLKAEHGTGRVMAPFVERQYGPKIYDVMVQIKSLFDPAGVLNPGIVISEDSQAHLRHLKSSLPVEQEVDRCVECGFCEPVCPSRDLTLTPRQRIVARRAEAALRAAGDTDAADALAKDYGYEALDTCAADGMCQTACPVGIDTGSLVRRLREQRVGPLTQKGGRTAARHWSAMASTASHGMSLVDRAPALASATSRLGRKLMGDEVVPQLSADLPTGGPKRRSRQPERPDVILLPSCTGHIFGGTGSATEAFLALCERAGVQVAVPDEVSSLCCGMPWSSKGLTRGAETMASQLRRVLERATLGGTVPVVTDAASCSEGLLKSLPDNTLRIEDAVPFIARVVLPHLEPRVVVEKLALHPTCSSTRAGSNEALSTLAGAVATEVFVPASWSCCAFAGDRGLLHPELSASATRVQAEEVRTYGADRHASCNRTCELGMSRATGATYENLLVLLEEATR